jgi:glycosyltransferase involved in cell wall biosynthesis
MKICFVAPNIYPFLSNNDEIQVIGGAEVQQVQLAELLKSEGHEISVVTLDNGQPDEQNLDGIKVYKAYSPHAGLPGLRFFHPRLTLLWRAIARADADIYYTRCAGMLAAVLSVFTHKRNKKFIYAGASDKDFIPGELLIRHRRDKALYEYGLRRADAILVQSDKQKRLLGENYGLDGTVIPNFFKEPAAELSPQSRHHVLWVGTFRRIKRPELFLELARANPDTSFEMVGGPDSADPSLFEQMREKAAQIPNLKFYGFLPFAEAERRFDACKVFVNTSITEGFPNTFLQAMRRGIPIVSFVDLDGRISNDGIGECVENVEELNDAVIRMFQGKDISPASIQDFYRNNFSSEGVVDKYRALLTRLSQ